MLPQVAVNPVSHENPLPSVMATPGNARKPSFRSLAEAVSFIEIRLQDGDLAGLFGACNQVRQSDHMCSVVFESLQEIHTEVGLRSLCLECSPPAAFPPDAETFKLGGHGKELGHIHIDFCKVGARWQLEEIWMCR
jgi:hypothetical protein